MTRISSVEQFRQGIDNILNQQARMNETQLQLSTGKRVNKPSDDPLATTQLLKLSTLKSKTEQYSRNIASARNELGLQETVLTGVSNLLMRVRELVIQANSAAQSNETRAVISDELNNRLDELLQAANTKDPNGEYIFSGFNSRTPAYVASGNGYVYQGDQGERLLQVSEDTQLAVRKNGDDLFSGMKLGDGRFVLQSPTTNTGNAIVTLESASDATLDTYTLTFAQATADDPVTYSVTGAASGVVATGTYRSGDDISFNGVTLSVSSEPEGGDTYTISEAGNQSIFQTVRDVADLLGSELSTNAERAKQSNDLSHAIDSLDQAFFHIQTQRTSLGVSLQSLDLRDDQNQDSVLRIDKQMSELEDLDYAQAVSELNLQTVALQAAQQSYIKIQGLSLFNFMR